MDRAERERRDAADAEDQEARRDEALLRALRAAEDGKRIYRRVPAPSTPHG